MNRRRALFLVPLALLAICCCPEGPEPPPPTWAATIGNFAGAVVDHFLGAPVSQLPQQPPPGCGSSVGDPSSEPDALGSPGVCGVAPGDDACSTCAKAHCCSEAVACLGEDACDCHLACRTAQCPPTEAARCGAVDGAYGSVDQCLSEHCTQCPRLP